VNTKPIANTAGGQTRDKNRAIEKYSLFLSIKTLSVAGVLSAHVPRHKALEEAGPTVMKIKKVAIFSKAHGCLIVAREIAAGRGISTNCSAFCKERALPTMRTRGSSQAKAVPRRLCSNRNYILNFGQESPHHIEGGYNKDRSPICSYWEGEMGPFWLGFIIALLPSVLLVGWLAWLGGVFDKPTNKVPE